jgi:selT/selW/selH-like putative selenoprotein
VRGGGGIFDVTVDGKVVFSKHEEGRFPDDGEVVKGIK